MRNARRDAQGTRLINGKERLARRRQIAQAAKLAGQHPDYLYVALKAYHAQGNAVRGRNNAIMGGMAKPFTNAELKSLADYIGSLPSDLQVVPNAKFR